MMELSLFTEQQARQQNVNLPSNPERHINCDFLIQPWVNNNKITNKTLPLRKQETSKFIQRGLSGRKKTIDERIQEMYRKYSNDGFSNKQLNQKANSREVYRQMLKQIDKAQNFKQIGLKREQQESIIENEPYTIEVISQKISSNVCAYDYKEIIGNTASLSPQKSIKLQDNRASKFQRMLKIRDRVRRKNSVAVSKLKEKYRSEYNPSWPFSQRDPQPECTLADREKAKMKIRIRNQSKSKNIRPLSPQKEEFKVVGVYSNAFQYTIDRGSNYSSGESRPKCNAQLSKTYNSFRH